MAKDDKFKALKTRLALAKKELKPGEVIMVNETMLKEGVPAVANVKEKLVGSYIAEGWKTIPNATETPEGVKAKAGDEGDVNSGGAENNPINGTDQA